MENDNGRPVRKTRTKVDYAESNAVTKKTKENKLKKTSKKPDSEKSENNQIDIVEKPSSEKSEDKQDVKKVNKNIGARKNHKVVKNDAADTKRRKLENSEGPESKKSKKEKIENKKENKNKKTVSTEVIESKIKKNVKEETKKGNKNDKPDNSNEIETSKRKNKKEVIKKTSVTDDDKAKPSISSNKRKVGTASEIQGKKPRRKITHQKNQDEGANTGGDAVVSEPLVPCVCSKLSQNNEKSNVKICSWNVDGIRAWMTKNGHKYLQVEQPDIICLQETRCPSDKMPEGVDINLPGYHKYISSGEKEGYSGVAIYSKLLARNVEYGVGLAEFDEEGRVATAEYSAFYLVCVYVPNAGRGLVTLPKRLKWNEVFLEYIKKLDEKKPVIICGDMNVAHNEIDLTNPKSNKKNAGFTPEERQGMTTFLNQGFIDTFRFLYPQQKEAYTFWSYMRKCREKNIGWRLDYFIISERLKNNICDSIIQSKVLGSDHCPINLFIFIRNWPEQFKIKEED